MHSKRVWCATQTESLDEITRRLKDHSWTLCTGFEIGGYLFLNDSTSEDAIQEYAVVKKPTASEDAYIQVESLTVSWCSPEKLCELIQQAINGKFDNIVFFGHVTPRIETAVEHRARCCQLCA